MTVKAVASSEAISTMDLLSKELLKAKTETKKVG